MRSAMVRSSSSATSSTAESPFPHLQQPRHLMQQQQQAAAEELESPVGDTFEGGQLTTNPPATMDKGTDADRDPNVIYCAPPEQLTDDQEFVIRTAQIYPQQVDSNATTTAKKFVSYEILIYNEATISRRYTDFLQLYEGLRQEHPSHMQDMVFPKKCFMGNFSESVVLERVTAFTRFLTAIRAHHELKESEHFLRFLQDQELEKACRLLDERRSEEALPILENLFFILNKFYRNRANKAVLLVLCRLVAASAHPIPTADAGKWADMALKRFEGICDVDLLPLYVPLIKACVYMFWKTGRDKTHLDEMLDGMKRKGINVKNGPSLAQVLHSLDPRTESA